MFFGPRLYCRAIIPRKVTVQRRVMYLDIRCRPQLYYSLCRFQFSFFQERPHFRRCIFAMSIHIHNFQLHTFQQCLYNVLRHSPTHMNEWLSSIPLQPREGMELVDRLRKHANWVRCESDWCHLWRGQINTSMSHFPGPVTGTWLTFFFFCSFS